MKTYHVTVTQTEEYSKVVEIRAASESDALRCAEEKYTLESLAEEKNTYQGASTVVEIYQGPPRVYSVEELFNIDEDESDAQVIRVEELSDRQKEFLGLPAVRDAEPSTNQSMTFQVGSSGGSLEVKERTGGVVRCMTLNDEDSELKKIVSFDVEEYRRYHRLDTITGHVDILDIGYTTSDNQYEPPVADWREEMRKQREENNREGT